VPTSQRTRRPRHHRSARRGVVALLVAALCVLGACSDSTGEDPTTTIDQPATTASEDPATTAEADSPSSSAPSDVDPADFEDGSGLASFATPAGDIGCMIALDGPSARCDVTEPEFEAPPAPADCQLDHGHAVVVDGEEPGSFLCAGDTVLGSDQVLEDGERLRYGPFTCRHEDGAVDCAHTSGHGFRVSTDDYELY
jgi:hypothetical protein